MPSDPLSFGYRTIGADINKADTTNKENGGIVGEPKETIGPTMNDKQLIDLSKTWLQEWNKYIEEIAPLQDKNETYWLGKQLNTYCGADETPIVDNIIFEALETFLPIATRAKAEPIVESDNTEEGDHLSDSVAKMLQYKAQSGSLNIKLKKVVRHWALYLMGVVKFGWSEEEDDIEYHVVRPQNLILDPKSHIESAIYKGSYIGEYIIDTANKLIKKFPKKKAEITKKVSGKLDTKIKYIQWSTNEYVFWTMDNEVLDTIMNPHWNYPETKIKDEEYNEYGDLIGGGEEYEEEGNNHFKSPQMPYVFLSILSLDKRPHDETNLISQNISNQDLINKRLHQIDRNADNANSGLVIGGGITEEQAMKIGSNRRKGYSLWAPGDNVNNIVKELPAQPLPSFIYESLLDSRNELKNIFGIRGSSAQGIINEKTLGGKNIIKGQDSDRIGGGVTVHIEEFISRCFNWMTQLMYVYYDEPKTASVLGKERAREYIQLSKNDFDRQLVVGVKEGSMIPKDPMNQRGEALELWAQGALDPITLFDRLEFPNPRESAKNLFLWKSDPMQLFPELQQQEMSMPEQQIPQ